jgi:hypothetical protein
MTFSNAQPAYAEHGIITFPVGGNKKPAIRNFQRIGADVSRELTTKPKLAGLPAIGFTTDHRNGVTVLDINVANENVLADALNRHGQTPLIARTGSGKFHAYYRHNGERRKIRPWRGLPIDLLGTGGFVVAPPSQVAKGEYSFIQGSLDDVDRLPVLRNVDLARPVQEGERNNKLWRHCMKAAHHVESFDELLDVARTFNDDCLPPLEDDEVVTAAQSAWGYTQRGQNRFGQHGAWFPLDEVKRMIDGDQDAALLLMFLRANQGPDATFMCTNGLADTFNWTRKRLADARLRLIELGYFKPVRQAGYRTAALHRWTKPRGGQN